MRGGFGKLGLGTGARIFRHFEVVVAVHHGVVPVASLDLLFAYRLVEGEEVDGVHAAGASHVALFAVEQGVLQRDVPAIATHETRHDVCAHHGLTGRVLNELPLLRAALLAGAHGAGRGIELELAPRNLKAPDSLAPDHLTVFEHLQDGAVLALGRHGSVLDNQVAAGSRVHRCLGVRAKQVAQGHICLPIILLAGTTARPLIGMRLKIVAQAHEQVRRHHDEPRACVVAELLTGVVGLVLPAILTYAQLVKRPDHVRPRPLLRVEQRPGHFVHKGKKRLLAADLVVVFAGTREQDVLGKSQTSREQAGLIAHIVLVHLVKLAADKLGVAVGGTRVLVHEVVDLPLELVCFEKRVDSAQCRIHRVKLVLNLIELGDDLRRGVV